MSPSVVVRDLAVRYGRRLVVHGVDLDLHPGQLTALVGPNGSGKTTLQRALAGLLPRTGTVDLAPVANGRPPGVAYVPQRLGFDPAFPMTVGHLVATGRRRHLGPWRRPGPGDRALVRTAVERVGMARCERRLLGELSGGQLQRVVLARALTQEADVLLLDEPLSGVDALARSALLDLLGELAAEGRTVVVATHDLALVRRHFARVIGLNGTVVADRPAAEGLDVATMERVFTAPEPLAA
ncbi:MAG: metal ABC transporter ATP-binding protein [Kineosporiaceae bacterium]